MHDAHTSSHEPLPSIHMSVSEPVGQNLCFLPETESGQVAVYACMFMSICMYVNGNAFGTLYSMSGFVARREDHFQGAANVHKV